MRNCFVFIDESGVIGGVSQPLFALGALKIAETAALTHGLTRVRSRVCGRHGAAVPRFEFRFSAIRIAPAFGAMNGRLGGRSMRRRRVVVVFVVALIAALAVAASGCDGGTASQSESVIQDAGDGQYDCGSGGQPETLYDGASDETEGEGLVDVDDEIEQQMFEEGAYEQGYQAGSARGTAANPRAWTWKSRWSGRATSSGDTKTPRPIGDA
jgi:hypothetical protein